MLVPSFQSRVKLVMFLSGSFFCNDYIHGLEEDIGILAHKTNVKVIFMEGELFVPEDLS